jgi:hypothetical protein
VRFGPLAEEFPLTLRAGHRGEALGPLFHWQETPEAWGWGFSPWVSYQHEPGVERTQAEFLYPLVSFDQYGSQYRFHIVQFLSWSGGESTVGPDKRRFTLFPTDQIANLYIGPVDFTLSGQPTSLVDFHKPDLDRYPRFAEALQHAEIAELAPGDVLYMPSLWFHHVESLDPFGAMVNFWWRDAPPHMTAPIFTLLHGLMTIRDMNHRERQAWRVIFDHYLFRPDDEEPMAHIPPDARGLFAAMTPDIERRLKATLMGPLSR